MTSALPRVLVVDDEPRALELLRRTLRGQARVETASSGDEAWQLFQECDFSLVIADQRMPGMSGVDLLVRVADRDETVGRILLTGYADLEATVAAINRGRVHAYLHKPCAPPDLQSTVKGVLDRVELARENARLLVTLEERKTELDRVLSDLEGAQARVLASERLAAIGQMAAMIVHDLRTPLTVLGSLEREIAGRAGPDIQLEGLCQELRAEVTALQEMCEKLLDATRVSDGPAERSRARLDEVVASALAAWTEPALAQGVELDLQLVSQVELELDEAALRRALRNLACNALEAMPEGGTLRVETGCEQGQAWVRISDSGPGIPEAIADRLFEPFVSAGKSHGTGLGLAVVQQVMDDHQGQIELDKTEGGGAAFTLRLPLPRGT